MSTNRPQKNDAWRSHCKNISIYVDELPKTPTRFREKYARHPKDEPYNMAEETGSIPILRGPSHIRARPITYTYQPYRLLDTDSPVPARRIPPSQRMSETEMHHVIAAVVESMMLRIEHKVRVENWGLLTFNEEVWKRLLSGLTLSHGIVYDIVMTIERSICKYLHLIWDSEDMEDSKDRDPWTSDLSGNALDFEVAKKAMQRSSLWWDEMRSRVATLIVESRQPYYDEILRAGTIPTSSEWTSKMKAAQRYYQETSSMEASQRHHREKLEKETAHLGGLTWEDPKSALE